MKDFNIDIGISNRDHDKLEQFCCWFNLQSLIKKELALQKRKNLTNKPLSFQSSSLIKTGLSDHHKLIATLTRLNPKTVNYRSFKNFAEKLLFKWPEREKFDLSTNDPNENYRFITDTFIKIGEPHATLKKRFARGNRK